MSLSGANIDAFSGETVGPSDILRVNPWGSIGSSTSKNTEVIAINNSVIGMLAAGDVRKNYIMIGATWTAGGVPPPSGQAGTNKMSNSTMETFVQGGNCFGCHNGNMLGTLVGPPPVPPFADGLSHVYGPLKMLFP